MTAMSATEKQAAAGMDVRYVAHLARLALSDEEVEKFESQLGQVLEYVRQLDALDVSDVEPTAHAMPVQNVFRADEPRPGLDRDLVLENAPKQRDDQFVVPKIIE
jgi:aspartyl-tRNA(Asn)/glutamyl-tRNA(Gln) amidotransferase subunit C